MLIRTILIPTGEVNVYQDCDGYHAERWNEKSQLVVEQSDDYPTEAEAIESVTPAQAGKE